MKEGKSGWNSTSEMDASLEASPSELSPVSYTSLRKLAPNVGSESSNRSSTVPYTCDICNKSCANSKRLRQHVLYHRRPHTCDICQRSFSVKATLQVHQRIHTGEKPYECSICQKSFSAKGRLRVHKRTHTGEKPYECDICQKSFSEKRTAESHKRKHTEENTHEGNASLSAETPYKCDICNKSYVDIFQLKKHKEYHRRAYTCVCEICQKSLSTKQALKLHYRRHTEESPLEYNIYSEAFPCKDRLQQHLFSRQHQKKLSEEISSGLGKPNEQNLRLNLFPQPPENQEVERSVKSISTYSISNPSFQVLLFGCSFCDEMFEAEKDFLDHCSYHVHNDPSGCIIDDDDFLI